MKPMLFYAMLLEHATFLISLQTSVCHFVCPRGEHSSSHQRVRLERGAQRRLVVDAKSPNGLYIKGVFTNYTLKGLYTMRTLH